MRTWYGSPAYFVLGAVHAVVFWVTVSALTPLVLLVAVFNERRRCLHDILVGTVVINNEARSSALRARPPAGLSSVTIRPLTNGGRQATLAGVSRNRASNDLGCRDPAFARHAAVLPDRAVALPLPAGPGGAEGVHASGRRARARAQRPPHPRRLPPQPVDRLSAGLRDLPRLRLGPRHRRRVPRRPAACGASPSATPTSSARCGRWCRRRSNIRCSAPISTPATATAAWPT